jgi:hypothetical protein
MMNHTLETCKKRYVYPYDYHIKLSIGQIQNKLIINYTLDCPVNLVNLIG